MPNKQSSLSGYGLAAILIALVFIIGPVIVPAVLHVTISLVSMGILILVGVVLLIVGATLITFSRLYYKAPANRAFVRTGRGGSTVVIDGGALVIPIFHDVIWVNLEQMRIDVLRHSADALLTKDYLRADIEASFFIYVPKEKAAVLQAATSMGVSAVDERTMSAKLSEKFVSALRSVAAGMEITELLANRAQFQEAVKNHVAGEITSNGLVLDTVTISKLDQTPRDAVPGDQNIFDAQGHRRAAEIIAEQMVRRNQIELTAQRQIEQEKVNTRKLLNQQAIEQAEADAEKERQIKVVQAEAQQQATTAAAEQERLAGIAQITRDRDLSVAQVSREEAEAVAEQRRQQSVQAAEIARQQAIEVADRDRQIAIAERERLRAEAEAERLAAEAERTRREQEVATVQVTAEAERQKNKNVIAAQADAERQQIDQETKARVAAFTVVTQAEAEQKAAAQRADARRTAAKAEADAATIQAEAQSNAAKRRAEGEQAIQLVPVQVARENVEVERARVQVLGQELEVKAQHEQISRGLQVDLAKIEAARDVARAQAEAMGRAFGQANLNMWGSPDDVAKISERFLSGQSFASLLQGFTSIAPDGAKDLVGAAVSAIADVARDKGTAVDRDHLAATVEETISSNGNDAKQ